MKDNRNSSFITILSQILSLSSVFLRPNNEHNPLLINPIPHFTWDYITCKGDAFTPSTGQHNLLNFCFCRNNQGNKALLLFPISLPKSETENVKHTFRNIEVKTSFLHRAQKRTRLSHGRVFLPDFFNRETLSNLARAVTWKSKG